MRTATEERLAALDGALARVTAVTAVTVAIRPALCTLCRGGRSGEGEGRGVERGTGGETQ